MLPVSKIKEKTFHKMCYFVSLLTFAGKPTNGVLLHQEIAPAHKSMVPMAAVLDCGFDLQLFEQ